jgi:hypothetical protein
MDFGIGVGSAKVGIWLDYFALADKNLKLFRFDHNNLAVPRARFWVVRVEDATKVNLTEHVRIV